MATVDGKWDCTVTTPFGAQRFTLSITASGDRFTGSAEGAIGAVDIPEGTVTGDTLEWSMAVSKPMALTLTARATVSGDQLSGEVTAGAFGQFPISGTRA